MTRKSCPGESAIVGRATVLAVFLISEMLITTASAQLIASAATRPRRLADTWFEGWYTRITADNGEDSVGLIVGSYLRLRGSESVEQLESYVAILKRNSKSGALEVYEYFPRRARIRSASAKSQGAWTDAASTAFQWEAEEIGRADDKEICIQLPNGASLSATIYGRQPWQPTFPNRGPEAMAEHMRILRCHWSVFSLASRARFVLTTPDSSLTGTGYAHQETNWGEAFPKAYVWAQGSSPDGRDCFALAGGMLPIGGIFCEGWLLGLRTTQARWDFRPQVPGTAFTTHIDAGCGTFSMHARSPLREVEIELAAAPWTFTALAIPTKHGFVHDTIQSFSADACIRAYRCGPVGSRILVDSLRMTHAAIEFGGEYLPRAERPAGKGS